MRHARGQSEHGKQPPGNPKPQTPAGTLAVDRAEEHDKETEDQYIQQFTLHDAWDGEKPGKRRRQQDMLLP